MSVSTSGIELSKGSQHLRNWVELLSSMRFAISLLTVICIASVIGTVLQQHQPINNYVNQFGPFWTEVFGAVQLFSVYSAWWFLLILAFLVVSTSLCIVRNTPKILADLKIFKENIREQSLKAFPHKAEVVLAESGEAAAQRMGQTLASSGWKVKLQRRDTPAGTGWMVAAKTGASNKLGYIAAHSAIVLICVGALLDGDMMVRAQMWLNDKAVFTGGGLIADVPEQYRLSDRNPTFRGNLLVTEGTQSGTAILAQPTGVVLQELPFDVELKRFIVEYYDTGMPKLFASDIVIHDRYTGERKEARVEVNAPVSHRGINIYQSSFDDGGSLLKLRALPMGAPTNPFLVEGRVGESTSLSNGDERITLEFTGLRVINVENFDAPDVGEVDVRRVDLRQSIEARLGSAHKTVTHRELRNVGPSVMYKLRDASGQAVEYHNYMLPTEIDGNRMFLLGVREIPSEPFRFLRIPADDQDSIDGFIRLRSALADPTLRAEAVKRYVAGATDPQRPELMEALTVSAMRAIDLFAGQDSTMADLPRTAGMETLGGLQAVSAFMEVNVPPQERERAGEVLLRILNGTLFELLQLSRERAGLAPAERSDATAGFMTLAVLSLSDSFYYPAPLTFKLEDFEHVQASVFQVARAPGQSIVYFGCLLLIIGVFAMLYVREKRLWIWLAPPAEGQDPENVKATMAMSTNRKLMDNDRDFQFLRTRLLETKT